MADFNRFLFKDLYVHWSNSNNIESLSNFGKISGWRLNKPENILKYNLDAKNKRTHLKLSLFYFLRLMLISKPNKLIFISTLYHQTLL